MNHVSRVGALLAAVVLGLGLASEATAKIPFVPFCTCRVSVNQYPPRPACVENFEPDVIRLCPAGSSGGPLFDSATFDLTVLDALATPVSNEVVSLYEISGNVNIANGGATTVITDDQGKATVTLSAGSGHGQVGVCVAGVPICWVNVRSPDVANTALPSGCAMPIAGSSFVNSNDKSNSACGFAIKFGPVTSGANDAWDLNCDNFVNSFDTQGQVVPGYGLSGGWLQHFGHGGLLGAKTSCP